MNKFSFSFNFKVYFFRKKWGANLNSKSDVLQITWNLVQVYVVISWLWYTFFSILFPFILLGKMYSQNLMFSKLPEIQRIYCYRVIMLIYNPWDKLISIWYKIQLLAILLGTQKQHFAVWKKAALPKLDTNKKQVLLHKKWIFPLRISSVNVTKSAGNCGFGHIYWRNT